MIVALIGALCIGISLGLLGSGGSILTVPVLVYVLHHEEKPAMAESLAIVGSIALIGAMQYALKKLIDWRSVIYFGLPGMVGAYGGAWIAGFIPGAVLLIVFAMFMLLAAAMMWRPVVGALERGSGPQLKSHGLQSVGFATRPIWRMVIEGLFVGAITGMIGAGGGFLIIPALVLLGGLNMHVAVGTSLCIIAMKSATGFVKYLDVVANEHSQVNWTVIGLFIAVGAVGSFAGKAVSGRINHAALKKVFAVFLMLMSGFILVRESLNLQG